MPRMPPGGENKSAMKGMSRAKSTSSETVSKIEEHSHAGEQGANHGVVFKLPHESDITDHSCVRELD
jgi:hypothetical protein